MLGFLRQKLSEIFRLPNRKKIVDELEFSLLEAGVALEVVDRIMEEVRDSDDPRAALRKALLDSMKPGRIKITKKPYIVMVCGINGTGKTTTAAKLASYFLKSGKQVVVAASDTFRAAAIEQLEEHCKRLGVRVIKHRYGADPAAVAFDAVKHAETTGKDVVIVDTAGRLHVDSGLMRELEKIKRVVKPDLSLLTLDATTGNDAVDQARAFDRIADGFVITKFDIDERGGAVISVSAVTGKPIYFLGKGQDYGDLREFNPEEIVRGLGL